MTIVLLSGKQGSGKTATQNKLYLAAARAGFKTAYSMNFADALYGLHDRVLDGLREYGIDPKTKKDRTLLQLLGTEWGRAVHGSEIWVNILRNRIHQVEPGSLIIVGDCRFENEFDAFPRALRVRLAAAESVRRNRAASWGNNTTHPSETGLDRYADAGRFDLEVKTDGLIPVDGVVELILAQLQKSNWVEKRSEFKNKETGDRCSRESTQ